MAEPEIASALQEVLSELIDGATAAGWVLNPGDAGLLKSLDRLSAEEASITSPGGASIAAHVDHLRYSLQLLNRWSVGEEPFADANYAASWQKTRVSEAEWVSRREELRREAYAWREAIERKRDVTRFDLTTMIASLAHLAYHLGAIRQMNRTISGPPAKD